MTKRRETLTNDRSVNLLDIGTEWKAASDAKGVLLDRQGIRVYESAAALLREARSRGARTAVVSSSQKCAAILRRRV